MSGNTSGDGGVSRNEALGRKKNYLIESTKHKSATRNARKLEIRKRSLTSKAMRSWNSCQWSRGGLGYKKPMWGSSGTWQRRGLHRVVAFSLPFWLCILSFEIQLLFLVLSLTLGRALFCRLPFNMIILFLSIKLFYIYCNSKADLRSESVIF